jgi:hypothetical protein
MRHGLEKLVQRGISRRGVLLHRAAPERDVRALIQRLRPVTTQYPLVLVGPQGDGGYLVPDALDGITTCFSPGVADNSSFERACIDRGMRVFMADYSVDSASLDVDVDPSRYTFLKKFIGAVDDEEHVTMERWIAESGVPELDDLLLQMDIEGVEYTAILSTPDRLLARFRVMAFEFHDLHLVWDEPFLRFAGAAFDKLLRNHVCVHIHPNGSGGVDRRAGLEVPRVAELTFLRRDVAEVAGFATQFPHPLDHDNGVGHVVPLPATWYRDGSR